MSTITPMKTSAQTPEPVSSTHPVSLAERWADRRAEAQVPPSREKKDKRDAAEAGLLLTVSAPQAEPPAFLWATGSVRTAEPPSDQRPAQKAPPGATSITVPVEAESRPRRGVPVAASRVAEVPAAVASTSAPAAEARAWPSFAAPGPVQSQPASAESQLVQPQPAPAFLQPASMPREPARAEDAAARTGPPVTSNEPVLVGLLGVSAAPTERTVTPPVLPSALPSAQTAPPPTPPTPPSPAGMTVTFPSWGQGHEVRAQWLPSGVVLTPSSERVGLALAAAPKGELNEISQWHLEQTDPDGQRRDQRRQREHDAP